MTITLKDCTKDVLDEICEKLGSQSILNCEQRGIYDDYEEIYQIELDNKRCRIVVNPDWINIIRDDVTPPQFISISDFRFEEVIIK